VANRPRRLLAEFIGCVLLGAVVIGSGIAAQQLSPGNVGLQLLENVVAIVTALYAIVVVLSPISGAHLNPLVSLLDALDGRRSWADAASYIPAQVAGFAGGAVLANAMFGLPAVNLSTQERATWPHLLAEVVATAGLMLVIFALARQGRERFAPVAVAGYIAGACFFTSSACFVNPALTLARSLSDSLTGIVPASVGPFVLAQVVGAALGYCLAVLLIPKKVASDART
jgi:arsenate reductase